MKKPNGDLNQLLRTLDSGARFTANDVKKKAAEPTCLDDETDKYLVRLIRLIREGKRAVVIVETNQETTSYLFSNADRADAVSIMGRVLESTGRKMGDGGSTR